MAKSLAEIAAIEPGDRVRSWYAKLTPGEQDKLRYEWKFWARPEQLPPKGEWRRWFVCAGRGYGKTRIGAEWIRSIVCGPTPLAAGRCRRVAIVAETAKDVKETIANGPSGILAVHPPEFRPTFTERGGFTWPNGAVGLVYNGTRPDQLRGPGPDAAWCDELAKWQYAQETWDNLMFSLRGGDSPQVLITTTPRPIKIIKTLIEEDDGERVIVTRGSLYDNRANLPPEYVKDVIDRYAGTRLGRQEIDGEIVDDVPGALWTRAVLDAYRKKKADTVPKMQRIVVAIDPAAKASDDDDDTSETGIIVAGIGTDGRGYVIDDRTCRLSPRNWARVAVAAYEAYEADAIIAEINNGGEMVKEIIRSEKSTVPVLTVHATRGKVVRAEPVSALYEQGRISHIGSFPALEDQLITFTPFGIEGDGMSDRADALVWALTKLFPSLVAREKRKPPVERWLSEKDRSKVTGY
jgi:phage terminase large subunit-like protein